MCPIEQQPIDGIQSRDKPDKEMLAEVEKEYTYNELYTQLLADEDLTIDIASESVAALRKGLSNVKAKANAKLKTNNLPPDNRRVEFKIIGEDIGNRVTSVKIWLAESETIMVKKLVVSKGIEDA